MKDDLDQLSMLSIFHYVVAAMMALFACFPFIHFFIGLGLLSGQLGETPPEARLIGIFFVLIAGVIITFGWGVAALVFFAGRNLAKHTHYTYCLVVAAVSCTFVPFGTVLGVFTIIVLMRDSVKTLFGQRA